MHLKHLVCIFGLFLCNTEKCTNGEIYFTKRAPHVQLPNGGVLSGSVKFSRDGRPYNAFVGISYATLSGRFQPSQLADKPWEGTKEATTFGNICVQVSFGQVDGDMMGDEDCLNLNVYVPMNAKAKNKLPVMVWLHGGGFAFGDGVSYGPNFFMDEDVIVVTLNYRLGVFGFLSTGDNVIPGNNGMKDVVVALRWVQKNIGAFGGDAGKVTIFGQSAGGAAVHYLLLSPMAKGLFHRAIAQSGSALGLYAYQAKARENAVNLANYLNCPSRNQDITSHEILDCLKGLRADELNKAQFKFRSSWPNNLRSFFFTPTAEPKNSRDSFLTQSPMSILSHNSPQNEVPFLVGATRDEGYFLFAGAVLENEEWLSELDSDWETVAPVAFYLNNQFSPETQQSLAKEIRSFYFGDKAISKHTWRNLTNLYSDEVILHSVYKTAVESAARWKQPVYLYQYAYPGPVSIMAAYLGAGSSDINMVGHSDDLQHQFTFDEEFASVEDVDEADETFSKNFVKLWTTFATTGKPEHTWGSGPSTSTKWEPLAKKRVQGQGLRWYKIDADPGVIEDPYKERMTFWDKLLRTHFNPSSQNAKNEL